MNNQTMDEKLDDILKIVIDIKDNAVHKDDFNKLSKRVEAIENKVGSMEIKVGAMDIKIGDMDGKMNIMGDDIKKVKAGVERTADILEQKKVINVVERQQIYHAADPFAMPA